MRILRTVLVLATIALLGLTAGSPASATEPAPGATLHLSWSAGTSLQVYSMTLTCSPNGGGDETYSDVDRQCGELMAVNGNFAALGHPGQQCANYQGWTIRTMATGVWFGQPVHHDVVHANMCVARMDTGLVFQF